MKKKLFVFFVVLLLFLTLNLQPIQSFESNKYSDTKYNNEFTKYQKNFETFDNQKTFPIAQSIEENWYKHLGHYMYDKISPTCVCKTHDNGYAISGYARRDPNFEEDIFILKLDKHGDPINIYYYDFFNGYNYAYDIKEIQKTTAGEYSYILTGLSTVKEFSLVSKCHIAFVLPLTSTTTVISSVTHISNDLSSIIITPSRSGGLQSTILA